MSKNLPASGLLLGALTAVAPMPADMRLPAISTALGLLSVRQLGESR